VALEKKREFRGESYWGKPVPGVGDPKARLWIVGLAPAAHGANRTGRMFTGDSSGNWLYRALHKTGFASQPHSLSRADGMKLRDVYISAAARCAPPDNKPTPEEISTCSIFLDEEWECLKNKEVILALGGIAFQTVLKLLQRKGVDTQVPRPKFAHNQLFEWDAIRVLTSYHPSRQNTNTGRLTEAMWDEVYRRAKDLL